LRLKHATCPRVRSTTSSSHAVFWFAMDRSRRASSVSERKRRARLFVMPNTPRAPNNPKLSEAG
jgi:hypothetical protein